MDNVAMNFLIFHFKTVNCRVSQRKKYLWINSRGYDSRLFRFTRGIQFRGSH